MADYNQDEITKLRKEHMDALRENAERMSLGEQSSDDMSPDAIAEDDMAMRSPAASAQADQAKLAELSQQTTAANGKLSAAGDATMAGGMIGGNPYVAGAGLALSTIGKIDDAKRAGEQAKIDAYNKKIMAKRSAIRNMFA